MINSKIFTKQELPVTQMIITAMSAINIIIISVYDCKYDTAILFSRDCPHVWGQTPSIPVAAVFTNYGRFFIVVFVASLLIVIGKLRRWKSSNKVSSIMIISLISTVSSAIYLFYIKSKYDETIYLVNDAIISSSGEPLSIMKLLILPRVMAIALAAFMIITLFTARKGELRKERF